MNQGANPKEQGFWVNQGDGVAGPFWNCMVTPYKIKKPRETVVFLFSEIKQFFWRYIQCFTELEDDVKGNADFTELYGADMAPVYIRQFRQLQLCKPFALPVIYDV